jgi:hypothetical protein
MFAAGETTDHGCMTASVQTSETTRPRTRASHHGPHFAHGGNPDETVEAWAESGFGPARDLLGVT